MSRKEKIQAMLASEPHDVFLRYTMAMELRKEGDSVASIEWLTPLTQEDPPYVAAFFMAGQQWVELNNIAKAREVLRNGIEAARKQNNLHAAGEMAELLSQLGAYGE